MSETGTNLLRKNLSITVAPIKVSIHNRMQPVPYDSRCEISQNPTGKAIIISEDSCFKIISNQRRHTSTFEIHEMVCGIKATTIPAKDTTS